MPRKALSDYNVRTLRVAIRAQNKITRSGQTGIYLPKLQQAKRATLVGFIDKNFKKSQHQGELRLKNKHLTHDMKNLKKNARRAAKIKPMGIPNITFRNEPLSFQEVEKTSEEFNRGTVWAEPGAAYTSDSLTISRFMRHKNGTTIQVRKRRKLIGYMFWVQHKNHAYLERLFLGPESRGKGVGSHLMQRLITSAKGPIKLHTGKRSTRSIKFYKKFGFRVTKTVKKYFGEEDAVEMVRR